MYVLTSLTGQHGAPRPRALGLCGLLLQAHIAEAILGRRPHAVVVETAVTPEHGLASGSIFACGSAGQHGMQQAYFVRWLCPMAAKLRALSSPTDSALWQAWTLLSRMHSATCRSCVVYKPVNHSCCMSTPVRLMSQACKTGIIPCYHLMSYDPMLLTEA